jgi:hypothetical protein
MPGLNNRGGGNPNSWKAPAAFGLAALATFTTGCDVNKLLQKDTLENAPAIVFTQKNNVEPTKTQVEKAWLNFFNNKDKIMEEKHIAQVTKTTVFIPNFEDQNENSSKVNINSNIVRLIQVLQENSSTLNRITGNGKVPVAFVLSGENKVRIVKNVIIFEIDKNTLSLNLESKRDQVKFREIVNGIFKSLKETIDSTDQFKNKVSSTNPTKSQYLKNQEPKTAPNVGRESEQKNSREVKTGQSNFAEFVRQNPDYKTNKAFMTRMDVPAIFNGQVNEKGQPIDRGIERGSRMMPLNIAEGHLVKTSTKMIDGKNKVVLHYGPGVIQHMDSDNIMNDATNSQGVRNEAFHKYFEVYNQNLIGNEFEMFRNISHIDFIKLTKPDGKTLDPKGAELVKNYLMRSRSKVNNQIVNHFQLSEKYAAEVTFNEMQHSFADTLAAGIDYSKIKYFQDPVNKNFAEILIQDTYNQNGRRNAQRFLAIFGHILKIQPDLDSNKFTELYIYAKTLSYSENLLDSSRNIDISKLPNNMSELKKAFKEVDVQRATGLRERTKTNNGWGIENGKIINVKIDSPNLNNSAYNHGLQHPVVVHNVILRFKYIADYINSDAFKVIYQ